MAKASSLENDLHPFNKLGDSTADKVFDENYPLKNFETYKFKATSTKNAAIDYSAKFDIFKKGDGFGGKGDDQLKVTFPISGTDFIARVLAKRKGELEAHVDFGKKDIQGSPCNFFANVNTSFGFEKLNFRLGANYFHSKVTVCTHVQTDLKTYQYLWNRINGTQGSVQYALATRFNLFDFTPAQYDAQIGYVTKDYDVFVGHSTADSTNSWLPQVVSLQGIFRQNKYTGAFRVQKDIQDADLVKSAELGGVVKVDDKLQLRAKIDNKLNLGFAVKYDFNSSYKFQAGAKIPINSIINKETVNGTFGCCPVTTGCQLELNI